MYYFKHKLDYQQKKDMLKGKTMQKAAEEIGMGRSYLIAILSQWRGCSKFCAYCITKYIDSEKEVNDFFERR